MTYGDIFIQILHEVTGRSKAEVEFLTNQIKNRLPGNLHRFDEELPPAVSQELLDALRQERSGILTWLMTARQN